MKKTNYKFQRAMASLLAFIMVILSTSLLTMISVLAAALYLYMYQQKGLIEELEAAHIMDCMECGACAYICPGRLHLTQTFKTAKQMVKDAAAKRKAAEEAAKAAEAQKKEA